MTKEEKLNLNRAQSILKALEEGKSELEANFEMIKLFPKNNKEKQFNLMRNASNVSTNK